MRQTQLNLHNYLAFLLTQVLLRLKKRIVRSLNAAPDRNGGDQTAFRRITAAYQNLLTQAAGGVQKSRRKQARRQRLSRLTDLDRHPKRLGGRHQN